MPTTLFREETDALTSWILQVAGIQTLDRAVYNALIRPLDGICAVTAEPASVTFQFIKFLRCSDRTDVVKVFQAIVALAGQDPVVTILNNAIARLQLQKAQRDPLESCYINYVPVVDRHQLRAILKEIIDNGIHYVVQVNGRNGTGRSHSWLLIQSVARSCNITPIYIDLTLLHDMPIDYACNFIAAKLKITFEQAIPTTIAATENTIALRYADMLSAHINNAGNENHYWIVIDNIDKLIAPVHKELISALVVSRLRQVFQGCAIFLLGDASDYALHDHEYLVTRESLPETFTHDDLHMAAREINECRRVPLASEELLARLKNLNLEMANKPPDEACALARKRLAEIRVEC